MASPIIELKDAARWLRESTDEQLRDAGLSLQGTFDEIDDPVLLGPDGKPLDTWREGYPYEKRMSRKKYRKSKRALQIELIKAQNWIRETGQRVVVLFEGRDPPHHRGLHAASQRSSGAVSLLATSVENAASSYDTHSCAREAKEQVLGEIGRRITALDQRAP